MSQIHGLDDDGTSRGKKVASARSSSHPSPVEPGPLIGKGFTAEIFAWGENRALKLFPPGIPSEKIQREFAATRAVHATGYPAPKVYEIVNCRGRSGFVMDRVNGVSMVDHVKKKPWKLFRSPGLLAELHAQLHEQSAPAELLSQKDQIASWISKAHDLPAADKQAALESLPKLPDSHILCHGDFHPANILLTSGGPVVIDWSRATRGHPLGDVARTAHLIGCADLPSDSPAYMKLMLKFARSFILREYLRRYFQLRAGSIQDLEIWGSAQKAAWSVWRCAQ